MNVRLLYFLSFTGPINIPQKGIYIIYNYVGHISRVSVELHRTSSLALSACVIRPTPFTFITKNIYIIIFHLHHTFFTTIFTSHITSFFTPNSRHSWFYILYYLSLTLRDSTDISIWQCLQCNSACNCLYIPGANNGNRL